MPTYEYECRKCGKMFEATQSMRDPTLKTCPQNLCRMRSWGKGRVKRLLSSGAGLIFKGTGFYITDYRSEGYKQAAKKESESATPKKEGNGSVAAKPASTKETTPPKASKTGET